MLAPLSPRGTRAGQPPVRPRRQLIDGIRFRVRTGVPWRDVPAEFRTRAGQGPRAPHRTGPATGPS
ncbi:transposase [Streptomyces sp. NPDC004284]|uniref:transposase n=1 Tax=Streptomyces sp. NPDC004284 TaxID=3364695 RepID=UPI0036C6BB4C